MKEEAGEAVSELQCITLYSLLIKSTVMYLNTG